jgi:hypothetical protein
MQRKRAYAGRATKRSKAPNMQNLTIRKGLRVSAVLNLKRQLTLSVSFHRHATSRQDTKLLHLTLRDRLQNKGVTEALNARNNVLNELKRRLLKIWAAVKKFVLLRAVSKLAIEIAGTLINLDGHGGNGISDKPDRSHNGRQANALHRRRVNTLRTNVKRAWRNARINTKRSDAHVTASTIQKPHGSTCTSITFSLGISTWPANSVAPPSPSITALKTM